ncbi:MAG: ABC transporter substrate-binding protein [Bacteroidota bacterium]
MGRNGCRYLAALGLALFLATAQNVYPAKKEINIWFTWNEQGEVYFRRMVENFNRSQSDFTVKPVYTTDGEMNQRVLTAVAGGTPPHLIFLDRYRTAQFAARGALTALDPYIARSKVVKANRFYEACWNECLYNGKTYGVPFETDCRLLMYNKRFFKEAGLDPQKPPRTWDELVEVAKTLTRTDADGNLTRLGFNPVGHGVSLVHYIWQNGGDVFDAAQDKVIFNNDRGVEALSWVVKFVDLYSLDKMNAFAGSFGSNANEPFIVGKEAMKSDGSWIYGNMKTFAPDFLRNDLGLAPLPYKTDRVTISGGFSFSIPRGAKDPELAWKFIEYASGNDPQLFFCANAGAIPARKATAESRAFLGSNPYWLPFVKEMRYARYRPVHPAFPEIEELIYAAMDEAVRKVKSPRQALDDAAAAAQRILDRYNRHFNRK